MTVNEKIKALRTEMDKEGIDFYLVITADPHLSEYVCEAYKTTEYISGFTGENATVIVSKDEALLWADGRFFIQAEREIKGTEFKLMKMGEEGVPKVEKYLKDHLKEGLCLGFDGECLSVEDSEKYEAIATANKAKIDPKHDLIGRIWENRPSFPMDKIWILEEKYAGKSIKEKLALIREKMDKKKADAHVLTDLPDIAWLLNLRGNDIECSPIFMAFFCLDKNSATLYVDSAKVPEDVKAYLNDNGVGIKSYRAIYDDLKESKAGSILYDPEVLNKSLLDAFPKGAKGVKDTNPTNVEKAVKNDTEIENTIQAHIEDGLAVTRFIYWLKQNIGKQEITEISASDYLHEMRKKGKNFFELSFETIAAYGPNAAMMHYTATPESYSVLKPEGFLLVDSGGQYYTGTTDITRTIVLGPLTQKMKEYFTVTLRSHIRLAMAKFPEGAIGQNLDALSRGPVWDMGLDYRCGTGHGVGHVLNVHEGPQRFHWRVRSNSTVWALKPGMITTDEPGLYIEDEFGIRHENELLCVKDEKTEYGQFLSFKNITVCPIDLEAVIPEMMTEDEKAYLNDYHRHVYETLSPLMTDEEKEWLAHETRSI